MANNVQNIKFLRNGTLYETREAALAALTGSSSVASSIDDGTAILARYGSGNEVKTIVGFKYTKGENSSLTIFDTEGASGDVETLRQEINAKLGTGITSVNTATAQLAALSGNAQSTSAETSVVGAKKYADELKNQMDYSGVTTGTGVYVTNVTQSDGIVSATTATLPTVEVISEAGKPITAVSENLGTISATAGAINAEFVNIADSGEKFTATTVEGALAEIAAEIEAMDKDASAVDGQVVTTVSEADGVVSETKANVKDLQLGGYSKDTGATGDISSTDTINAALSKLENKAAAITITNADGSINVRTGATGTDINVNIKSTEKVIKKDGNGGLYTDIKIASATPSSTTVKEEYALLDSYGNALGQTIKIYKDSSIVSITYITNPSDDHYQNLEYKYIDASGNTQTAYVDMSSLVLEAEFASGVTFSDGVAHGVVDSTSEGFLTVGADGFKLSGVQAAINSAIEALDVTGDTAVAGQYVAEIKETDGMVAVKSRANVSEAVLNNYSKGSDSGAVASTDTINQAISKLENQVYAAKAAATTKVEKANDANHLTLSSSTASDGSVTYTIGESNIASKTDLDALSGKTVTEIASSNNSISATSASTTNGTVKYDVVTDADKIQMSGFSASGTSSLSGIAESDSIATAFEKTNTVITENERVTANALTDLDGRLDVVEGEYISGVSVNGNAVTVANKVAPISITAATSAATTTGNEAIVVNTDQSTGAITLGIATLDCGEYY